MSQLRLRIKALNYQHAHKSNLVYYGRFPEYDSTENYKAETGGYILERIIDHNMRPKTQIF